MIWFVKTFWRSLLFVATLIGLLFIPTDVSDIPDAVAGWRRVFAVIDPVTALSIFSAIALMYIVWIDARPIVEKYRSGERCPIAVHNELAWEAIPFDADGAHYYKNICYLVVHNHGRKDRTARDVRVRTFTVGTPMAVTTKSGAEAVDLHHGEVEWFEIGSIIATEMFGIISLGDDKITGRDREEASKGVATGSYSFMRSDKSGIGLSHSRVPDDGYSANPMSFFMARVSASDLPTQELKFRLLRDRLTREGSEVVSPIEIESIKVL